MYINFLLLSAASLLIAFIVFRVIIKRVYNKHQRLTPVFTMLEILALAIQLSLFYVAVPTKMPYLPPLPESLAIKIISGIIFGIGIIGLFISWFGLGTKPSLGLDKNKLQTGGLYNYSRNPQLVGFGLIVASFTIIYFSYLVLIWFLLYIIVAYFMIKSEEEFLDKKYKEEYRDYCKKVPRIIKILKRPANKKL
jgi:protein-S-isoprenylcysteine O-methyltransferase Ste14